MHLFLQKLVRVATGANATTVPSKELCLERRHKFLFIKRLKSYTFFYRPGL